MKYIIKSKDATKLRETILSCVKKKKDAKEMEIHSWAISIPQGKDE